MTSVVDSFVTEKRKRLRQYKPSLDWVGGEGESEERKRARKREE